MGQLHSWKPIFILTLLTVCSSTLLGQITTTKVAPINDRIETAVYDSITNYIGKNIHQYIGQELYLNQLPENFQSFGYMNFLVDYSKSAFEKGNVYKSSDGFNSDYKAIAGKYFKVLDIIKAEKQNSISGATYYFLKLEEKTSKDILYYKLAVNNSTPKEIDHLLNKEKGIPAFPFIITGYFEKQKDLSVGKTFVFSDRVLKNATDIETGKPITKKIKENWKCIDLTIEDKTFILSFVFQNSEGEKILVPASSVNGQYSKGRTYTLSAANKYSELFGEENFEKILSGKVVVGMTDEMCLLSWGEPNSKNITTSTGINSEQWVYDGNYLYFDNGILSTIQ